MKVETIRKRGKNYLKIHVNHNKVILYPIIGQTKRTYIIYNPMFGGTVPFPKPQ